jgi:hypothetical protein
VLKTLKTKSKESESEITMCDRMQIYNIGEIRRGGMD